MKSLSKTRRFLVMALSIVCILFSSMPAMAAEQIAISQKKASLNIGEEISLSVLHTDAKPVWYSSNINIADVDSTGKVVAVSKGSATITARIVAKKYNSKITVNAPTIKLNKNTATIYTKGTSTSTVKLKATVKGARKDVTWESMNPMVATVDNQGNVTSVSKGITTIKATANGVDATCVLKVLESSISLNYTDVSLGTKGTGNSVKLVPDIVGSKKSIKWVSSDKTIAVVSGGKVTGKKPGTVVITATANGVDAVCNVTVVENVVTIGAESSLLYVGDTTTLKTNATADVSLLWESSNPEVVSVENGVLQALSVGTSLVSVKEAGKEASDTCLVTVKEKAFNIKEETVELSLYGTGKNYTLETDIVGPSKTITWKSSEPKIVSVSKGKLAAKKEGSVVITATANGVTDTVPVTVVYNPSVKLNYKSYSLHTVSGKNVTLKATVTGDSKKVTWTSSDETIATVDSKGKVTAIAPGSVKIIATANDVSAECVIRVIETRTALNKETLYLNVDEVYELDYTIIGKSQSAKWTTGNKMVATVKNGVVTAKDYGQTSITLTANGVKTVCKVVVTDKKPCEHSFDEGVFTIEPTCENKGMKTFTCLSCGETEIVVVDALGHEFGDFEVDVEPTCNESGMKSKHCVRCDLTTESTLVDALEHNFEEKYVLQGTCVTKGVKVLQCSYCYAMNIEETAIAGHNYEKSSDSTEATCEEDGTLFYSCSVCGNSYHETKPALGHDYSGGFVTEKEATCTEDGLKSIPCSRCESKMEETIIPALGHSISEYTISTEPTCESKGIKAGTCSVCGETVEEEIDALGHDYATNFTTDTEATCTTDGSKSKHCSRCTSKVEITVIPAHGHNMVNGTCSHCGYTKSYTEITLTKGDLTKAGISTTGNIVIPETFEYNGVTYKVTGLGEGVFSGCNQITSITIPDSVTSIDDAAFGFCTGLQTITIPGSVEKIGDAAFMGCTSLESVVIMEGVTEIGANAFNGCTSLETVTIPNTVTKIGENAFYNCTDIETLVIPDSVTEIGTDAFKGVGHVIYNGPAQGAPWGADDYNNVCAEGNHSYGDFVVDIPATCTSVGSKSKHCSVCGNKAEITEIPMLPHTYNNGVETTAPTCETKGIKTYTCSVCSHSYDADISALGHDYSNEFTVDIEATCTAEGGKSRHCSRCESKTEITVIDKADHTYNDGVETLAPTCESKGVKTYTCSACGDVKTEDILALGHDYSDEFTIDTEATCTSVGSKSKHCSRCSSKSEVTEIPMASHSYNSGEITSEPTCEDKGVKTYTCSVCSHTYDTDVAALGHDYADEFTTDVEPTCTTDGSKSRHCSRCESKTEITSITELGHDFGEWVITTPATEQNTGVKKRECNRCDYFEEGVVPVIGHTHNYETSVTAPTCEENGYTTYTCSCGDTYTDDVVSALGHDYSDEFTVDIEATCTAKGSKSKHCSRCESKTEVTEIPMLSHDYDSGVETTAPTCESKGVKTYTCTSCEHSYTEEIAELGHDYALDFTVDAEADCDTEGSKSRHCSRCESKTEVTVIPALGHTVETYTETTAPGCETKGVETGECTVCGESVDREIDALGHDYSEEFTTDVEPTCVAEGSKSRHCSRCENKTEITAVPIDNSKHSYNSGVVTTEATCTDAGIKTYTCLLCSVSTTEPVDALGHDISDEFTVDTEATCITEGSKSKHCSRCEYKDEITVIPKGAHNFVDNVCTGCGAYDEYEEKVLLASDLANAGISTTGAVVIPEYYNYDGNFYKVVGIGEYAFKGCTGITSVVIPDTVTSLERGAFSGCSNLITVEMSEHTATIGAGVFYQCAKLKTVDLSHVTSLAENVFSECSSLETVTLPEGMTTIGDWMFNECGNLKSIVIPDSVVEIGTYAFSNCTNVARIQIPKGVANIGENAFLNVPSIAYWGEATGSPWGAKSRRYYIEGDFEFKDETKTYAVRYLGTNKDIVIPDGVEIIGSYFCNDRDITSLVMPDSVTEIGNYAFSGCTSLKTVDFSENLVTVNDGAFHACRAMTSTPPSTIKKVGEVAFRDCISIKGETNLVLSSVGYRAFSNYSGTSAWNLTLSFEDTVTSIPVEFCTNLVNLRIGTIPNSVTSIGNRGFDVGTTGTTPNITIPNSVTSIGTNAFRGVKHIVYYGNASGANWGALSRNTLCEYGCHNFSLSFTVDVEPTCTTDGSKSKHCTKCDEKTEVTVVPHLIHNFVDDVCTFCGETGEIIDITLTAEDLEKAGITNTGNVIIPERYVYEGNYYRVVAIGDNTFSGCTALTSVTIPNTVTTIGKAAFKDCSGLTSATLPNSLIKVDDQAFYNCKNMVATIPNSVTYVGSGAFQDCNKLTGTSTLTLDFVGGDAFLHTGSNYSTNTMYVTVNMGYVGANAFSGCKGLKSVTLKDNMSLIGGWAFYNCTGLERVYIPKSVTEIQTNAFYQVPEISYYGEATGGNWGAKKRYYYIEGDFSYLDETKESVQAYLGTDTHMVVPDGVKEIAQNMFNHTSNTLPSVAVTEITLPEGLEKIGSGAFGAYRHLTTINIPSTVTEIGSSAFSECSGLTCPIVIPSGVTSIQSRTFADCWYIPSVTISEGVQKIGSGAFEECTRITSIEIPNTVTTIYDRAFYNCKGVSNIAIPDEITSIGNYAFYYVNHITYNGSASGSPWGALAINSDCTYMGGHNYSDEFTVDTPATCIAEGSKSKHCTRCNDKTEVTVIPADPSLHDYSEEVTAEATCTEMGINTYTCTICSDTYAESIDALGHNYVNDICTRCSITKPNGDIVEDTVPDEEFIPELDNHEHDYHVHIVNASCESNGYTDYICSCGHHYTDTEVSALGHNVVAGECTNCNYTVAGLYLEDGTMVATWEESGIDVEKNYSLGYGLQDSIQTNTTGAFYVLSTKYRGQRVTKLVLPSDITSIGNNALWGVRMASQGTNTYVTNIVIPSNITNISESALSTFSGSVSYKSFTLTAENYEQAGISRTGDIVIPKTFEYEGDSYYVTTIGASAFSHCMDITSVVIPDSVTVIEKDAFNVCKNLASVSMPDSITRIGDSAFQGCAFETIHIPVKVKVIDVLAFYNCPSLQTVILPHGITSIESHAFGNCANLSETNIPYTVKSIKDRAFMSCEKLTEVIIPDGVTTIGIYAFLEVPHITYHGSASGRPWGAKEMNSCATLGHNFADEFTVDLEPTCIADGSKSKHCSECGAVTEETVIPADPSLHDYVEEVTTEPTCTEKGVTTYTCNHCSDTYTEEIATLEHDYSETILTEPTCESPGTKCITCTVCGDTHEEELAALGHDYVNGTCVKCGRMVAGAYDSNNNLIVSWDDLVNVYGLDIEKDYGYQTYKTDTSSFYYILTNNGSLSGMTRLIIPDNITAIGNYAFYSCSSLTHINLGNNVVSIGKYAFYSCSGLLNIDFPNSVTSIGEYAFSGCSELTTVNFGTQLSSIGDSAFSYCVNLTSIVIPDSVTTFGKYIFNGCTNLTNVDIGNGVVTIGENTFTCCVNLTDVTLGNNVSSIESSAFMSCSKLNTIVIPDSVTLIGAYAFSECTELSDLTIPNSVTSIGTNAFSNVPHINYNGPAEGSPWGALSIN